jgi:hypothetical protein
LLELPRWRTKAALAAALAQVVKLGGPKLRKRSDRTPLSTWQLRSHRADKGEWRDVMRAHRAQHTDAKTVILALAGAVPAASAEPSRGIAVKTSALGY